MIATKGRSLALLQQLQHQCLRATPISSQSLRVPALSSSKLFTLPIRSLATRPASRPKAHTGTPAAKKPRKTTVAKPAAASRASSAGSKKTTTTKKAAAKPKKAKKPKKKPAAAKKTPRRRVLTVKQKEAKLAKDKKAKIAELKTIALSPPAPGATTAWTVFTSERTKGVKSINGVGDTVKTASAEYRNFTPEQREHYNHLANQNKAKHNKAYHDFITSHTALEIYHANLARLTLKRLLKTNKGFKKNSYAPLKDERQVKGLQNAYNIFFTERQASGDYAGMTVKERGQLVGREWKSLSVGERKPYEDKSQGEKTRYEQERKTVLGIEPQVPKVKKTVA